MRRAGIFLRSVPGVAVLTLCAAVVAHAEDTTEGSDASAPTSTGWFARVDKTQAEQPHWVTPLATTTPRLEEEFRYDFLWQRHPDGTDVVNCGGSKGLELIPLEKVEIILGVPGYISHTNDALNGWADFPVLIKYRLVAANEQHGNYILTLFLGATFPTGTNGNGAPHSVITPTLAYGKGWGPVALQGTFGIGFPTSEEDTLGKTMTWNNALQYHVAKRVWPEFEANATFYSGGPRDGKKQVLLTPGLVVGRIHLTGRLGLTVGAGMQFAVSDYGTFDHGFIGSVRLPF